MKKFIYSFICFCILVIINFVLASIFNVEFLELSFGIGLILSVLIGFFSSSGGSSTSFVDMKFKHLLESDTRHKSHFTEFHMNIPLATSIFYTILSAIISIITYWDYFF